MALVAGIVLTARVTSATTISTLAVPSAVELGQSVSVNVNVSAVTDLYDYQFDIAFDPSMLQIQSVSDGGFLTSDGQASAFGGPFVLTQDNAGGLFSALDVLLGPVSGVSGSGTLLSITFAAMAPGVSSFVLSNIILEDSTGTVIDANVSNGRVDISASSNVTAVPEPASVMLLGLPLSALIGRRRRTRVPGSGN